MIWLSFETSAPNGRVTARVIPVSSATSGARIRPMTSIGRDTARANRSGNASASVFGTSSPKMIVNPARSTVTMTSAIPAAEPLNRSTCSSSPVSRSVRLTAA